MEAPKRKSILKIATPSLEVKNAEKGNIEQGEGEEVGSIEKDAKNGLVKV